MLGAVKWKFLGVLLLAVQFAALPIGAQTSHADEANDLSSTEPGDSPNYRLLDVFSDVLFKVQEWYVRKPDDWKLIEGAIRGMLLQTDLSSVIDEKKMCARERASDDKYSYLMCFGNMFERIRGANAHKIPDATLIQSAINGMLTSLDARSFYIKNALPEHVEASTHAAGSTGILLIPFYRQMEIYDTVQGSTSAKAGIQPGDIVAAIDGQSIGDITLEQANLKLVGPIGSIVRLRISRKGLERPITFAIVRGLQESPPVVSVTDVNDICYIKITSFPERAGNTLRVAIGEVQDRITADRIKGYILDLRNNPGGHLTEITPVASTFLKQGEIVTLRGRHSGETQRYDAETGNDLTQGKPMIVLVNGGTAGVAEIVAAALQDHRRATLVGTRSVGFGSVQTLFPVDEGSLRLSTSVIYTPSDRKLEQKGIAPDIVITQGFTGRRMMGAQELETFIPLHREHDKAFQTALDLLLGVIDHPSFPANPNKPPPT